MIKKVIIFIFIMILGIYIFDSTRSSSALCYNDVQSFINDGNIFYDFYHPDYYIDNKEYQTLTDYNRITIYHHKDPQNWYSLSFKDDDVDITIVVDRNKEDDYGLEEYILKENNIYVKKDFSNMYFIDQQDKQIIQIKIEAGYQNQIDDKFEDIGIQMLFDARKINKK